MTQPNPVQTFLLEADDLLNVIEEVVLESHGGSLGDDDINKLFRAFHTLKGSGAMFDFDDIAEFTHHVEGALDLVRNGRLAVTAELLDCVLRAKDLIKAMLQSRSGGESVASADVAALVVRITGLAGLVPPPAVAATAAAAPPANSGGDENHRIRFRPDPGVLARGTNLRALLDELRGLGACRVRADLSAVPPLEQLDPELCHVRFEVELQTTAGRNAIRDVFLFVEDGSEIDIQTTSGAPSGLPAAGTPTMVSAGKTAAKEPSKPVAKDATIRVTSDKLDRLVNLVGELVMNQSRLSQVAARLDAADLTLSVEQIERLVDELRDNVLGIRMMPIGSTFGRFKRLVHDLSAELGKEVDLVTEGAETEIDKTVLDQLADPLIHLIRNSLDHGIEPTAVREGRGKPRRGTIRLSAVHTGSNVVIRIQDDGKGLDREAILRKGRERGLVPAEADLSDQEVSS